MPTLLLLKGHPGSGKSTLASHLARRLQWPLIDKDDARDALGPLAAAGADPAALNAAAYEAMWRGAARQLAAGLAGVVVDCPLARRELFERALRVAQQFSADTAVLECVPCDEEAWRARLEARAVEDAGGDQRHKPQSWGQLQRLIASYRGCWHWTGDAATAPRHLLRLDTSDGSAADLADRAVQWLVLRQLAPLPPPLRGAALALHGSNGV